MKPLPIKILLAEDDPGHAILIQRNLKRAGCIHEIVHVSDGQQALDYLRGEGSFAGRFRDDPLLVVLDINMPGVDGIEVLRLVRTDPMLKDLPILVLTTTDDPREVEICYKLGCNVYITKPVTYEGFSEAVQRLGFFLQIVQVPPEAELRRLE